jgi:hypothetical protein
VVAEPHLVQAERDLRVHLRVQVECMSLQQS